MALSGQLRTSTTDGGSYFYVDWTASQNVSGNYSDVTWHLKMYCKHDYYSNAIKNYGVSINGTQVYGGNTWSNYNSGYYEVASGTIRVNHNNDGTKTFNINTSGGFWLDYGYGDVSGSTDFTLNTIPRDFTQTPTVTLASATTTSATFNWGTSETCDSVKYSLDGGSLVNAFSGSATSGSFTINNLNSNSSHTLYIQARRKDSQRSMNSSTINFSTSNKTMRIRVNGVWKDATPYVRVNGVWKVATPYIRDNNSWKRGK